MNLESLTKKEKSCHFTRGVSVLLDDRGNPKNQFLKKHVNDCVICQDYLDLLKKNESFLASKIPQKILVGDHKEAFTKGLSKASRTEKKIFYKSSSFIQFKKDIKETIAKNRYLLIFGGVLLSLLLSGSR